MAATAGRKGRPYRRARAQALADGGHVCWLCGHGGAGDADHEPSLQVLRDLGLDPNDPQYLRPAHGALSRCPTCGLCCNQAKGAKAHVAVVRGSRDW